MENFFEIKYNYSRIVRLEAWKAIGGREEAKGKTDLQAAV